MWLQYLVATPLYRMYDVTIDDSFFNLNQSTSEARQGEISENITIKESVRAQQHRRCYGMKRNIFVLLLEKRMYQEACYLMNMLRRSLSQDLMMRQTASLAVNTSEIACPCEPGGICVESSYGSVSCECNIGYQMYGTTCKKCDCGWGGTCRINYDGRKECSCREGFVERNGQCTSCDCGISGAKCSFKDDTKICECPEGYRNHLGYCVGKMEKFRALHTEEAFNGLFDFRVASKAPSGEILLHSQKEMKVIWCEIRTGGWCRHSQPRTAIWFGCAVAECGLTLSSNNRTPELRSPDRVFRITSFNFEQGVTILRRHCDTLVPTFNKSTQK
ncbi:hypothetical protein TNCV_3028561 [Trichonephila clavipes]|nr:hypothetical protein TNCV_3028561 [Trichonephila clavipes]